MGLMNDAIKQDAAFLANTDEFAEAATYTRQDTGAFGVTVMVERRQYTADQAENNVATQEIEVFIPNDSSKGITTAPAEGDRIALKAWDGDAETMTKLFSRILESDAGGWLAVFI